ncbi:hypothetical protein OIU85_002491 [Salix viminalis]|uniref:Laccase n=1 Tax=Salix viminalis TaxID=40686 RepID=A0A9Q0VP00_SALVM|nr:hypothetical protein OIU85_002491 [Salix viminalis]
MGVFLLPSPAFLAAFFISFVTLSVHPEPALAITRHYKFDVVLQNVTRLCKTRSTVTVNGKFPGPRIVAREGDRLLIKVVNHVQNNISIHWHGIRQLRSGWADGTAYITQCPIQTGQSYVYNYTIVGTKRHSLVACSHIMVKINSGSSDHLWRVVQCRSRACRPSTNATDRASSFSLVDLVCMVVGRYVHAEGQTTNVLLKTKPRHPNAKFFMSARPYVTGQGTFDDSTVAGILEYKESPETIQSSHPPKKLPIYKPSLPPINDTSFVTNFTSKLRSLASAEFPANVPLKVESQFFFTVGLGTNPCSKNKTCQGPNGTKFAASVNNVSFVMPTKDLLEAHYFGQSTGVYSPDFPTSPLIPFNYTGTPPNNTMVSNGTKLVVLPFNTSVELIMQDTSILGAESHPLHLHGFNFFVVGQGFGNFDPKKDTGNFNLVDPVERNTVGVPSGGWVAVRFLADNPGW